MHTMRLVCLAAIICFVSVAALAQQAPSSAAPPPTSDPQAVALVQRSLGALVGSATVSDVTLTGTARRIAGSDDETGTATLRATALGDSRIDLAFPSGNRAEVRNHSGVPMPDSLPPGAVLVSNPPLQPVGAWSGADGLLHGAANHNLMTDPTWFFPAFTLASLGSRGYQLSYVGPESLNSQAVLHVSALVPSTNTIPGIAQLEEHLSQIDAYFDPTTSQLVALEFASHPDFNAQVDITTRIAFSDYRAVNGAQIPFHVQRYLNGGLVLDFQASSVSSNSGLAPSTFALQ
jgi:hypothetical protein